MRIGFVGTGTMGTPIAGCLIRAGFKFAKGPVLERARAFLFCTI